MRGIDPRSASFDEVAKLAKTSGPKAEVAGTTVHRFNRRFMGQIFDQLERSEKVDFDDRTSFLEHTRRLSKKWVENARKTIEGKGLSNEQKETALWTFINDRENGVQALKDMDEKDIRAENYDSIPRHVKRMGHKIRVRYARRVDLLIKSVGMGVKSGLKDTVTQKFDAAHRKLAR